MPDWSYHVLFKPILSKLSASTSREFIHKNMNRIATTPGGKQVIHFLGREESSQLLKKNIGQIEFENSIGLSYKIDPNLSGTQAFANLGFGFIEVGPVSKKPISNQKDPIIHHLEQRIDFSESTPTLSVEQTITKLRKHSVNKPIFIRLSGIDQYFEEITSDLAPFTDGFIIDLTNHSLIDTDLLKLANTSSKSTFLSIRENQLNDLPLSLIENNFSGLVLEEGSQQKNEETLSSHIKIIKFLRKHHFTLPIITVGGILQPRDALRLLHAGSDFLLLSHGYVFSGPGLPKRIKEAQLDEIKVAPVSYQGWGWYWLFGFFIMIGGILALILSMTTIILPYDEHFLGMPRESIYYFNERILFFMAHDRMTLAGTMVSGGIIYMFLARYGIRNGLLWAKQATDMAAIIGFLGIFLFIGYGYFDWLHLLFWLVLLPFYCIGYFKTTRLRGTPSSKNRDNDHYWRKSLFGQFCFVVLGFSFIIGGMIISYIGITSVFVPTDLLYLCMPADMLQSFNERLIPVIAHDRAGFGSALLSVGILVLTVALWGFHQGNRWVWWLLLIGGIPAFFSGIFVHFAIGYTTFIHLLPAYFAFSLYLFGLFFSYRFFHLKK
ncbi:dihydroorotate dehydrogenase [Halalkalibacter okhensis]|uniref:Dihydroorotate dehydrogenase n=1 Tax=Halalkalibacter okhensis TaxID=333138 RepID=A0A0B0ICG4_9BACI|nr:dihydroorotate dehydrogenase [Halalkalibacter okhensis]KHF40263.1 dihydroorotate dehydrogenase [Halalkalibacter okhensis]